MLTFVVCKLNIAPNKLNDSVCGNGSLLQRKNTCYHVDENILEGPLSNKLDTFAILNRFGVFSGLDM